MKSVRLNPCAVGETQLGGCALTSYKLEGRPTRGVSSSLFSGHDSFSTPLFLDRAESTRVVDGLTNSSESEVIDAVAFRLIQSGPSPPARV